MKTHDNYRRRLSNYNYNLSSFILQMSCVYLFDHRSMELSSKERIIVKAWGQKRDVILVL